MCVRAYREIYTESRMFVQLYNGGRCALWSEKRLIRVFTLYSDQNQCSIPFCIFLTCLINTQCICSFFYILCLISRCFTFIVATKPLVLHLCVCMYVRLSCSAVYPFLSQAKINRRWQRLNVSYFVLLQLCICNTGYLYIVARIVAFHSLNRSFNFSQPFAVTKFPYFHHDLFPYLLLITHNLDSTAFCLLLAFVKPVKRLFSAISYSIPNPSLSLPC